MNLAIAEFFWKMQRKAWYSILGLDVMPLSLKNLLINENSFRTQQSKQKFHGKNSGFVKSCDELVTGKKTQVSKKTSNSTLRYYFCDLISDVS